MNEICFKMGRKHFGKGRKSWVQLCFQKLVSKVVKTRELGNTVKGLTHYQTTKF